MPGRNNGGGEVMRIYPALYGCAFANEKAACSHSISRAFAATRRKNGVSQHGVNMAKGVRWRVFSFGMPLPLASGAGCEDGGE